MQRDAKRAGGADGDEDADGQDQWCTLDRDPKTLVQLHRNTKFRMNRMGSKPILIHWDLLQNH